MNIPRMRRYILPGLSSADDAPPVYKRLPPVVQRRSAVFVPPILTVINGSAVSQFTYIHLRDGLQAARRREVGLRPPGLPLSSPKCSSDGCNAQFADPSSLPHSRKLLLINLSPSLSFPPFHSRKIIRHPNNEARIFPKLPSVNLTHAICFLEISPVFEASACRWLSFTSVWASRKLHYW